MEFQEAQEGFLNLIAVCESADTLRDGLFGHGKVVDRLCRFAGSHPEQVKDLMEMAFRRIADLDKRVEMQRGDFDEFKSREYADWKRVRGAIEHENLLVNHRLTWLFSSQAFLLTAYTLAFNEWAKGESRRPRDLPVAKETPAQGSSAIQAAPAKGGDSVRTEAVKEEARDLFPPLLLTIALFGIFICVAVRRGIVHAIDQLRRLDNWWHLERSWESVTRPLIHSDSQREDRRANLIKSHPPLQGDLRLPLDSVTRSDFIPVGFICAWSSIVVFTVALKFVEVRQAFDQYGVRIGIVGLLIALFAAVYKIVRLEKEIGKLQAEKFRVSPDQKSR